MSAIAYNGAAQHPINPDPQWSAPHTAGTSLGHLDLLREQLDLVGTKKGCDHGQCGACTVLRDGKRINACLTLAIMCDGADLVTIEGAGGDGLHPMQRAPSSPTMRSSAATAPGADLLCGWAGSRGTCRHPRAIREQMSGNLCRCGAYSSIVAAVEEACL